MKAITVTDNNLPWEVMLRQNDPNPFNPTTTLSFQLARPGHTTLKIFDMYGRQVAVLVDGMKSAGMYQEQFLAIE